MKKIMHLTIPVEVHAELKNFWNNSDHVEYPSMRIMISKLIRDKIKNERGESEKGMMVQNQAMTIIEQN